MQCTCITPLCYVFSDYIISSLRKIVTDSLTQTGTVRTTPILMPTSTLVPIPRSVHQECDRSHLHLMPIQQTFGWESELQPHHKWALCVCHDVKSDIEFKHKHHKLPNHNS